MKIGDNVKMSDKNKNHLGKDVCAYSGMEGTVTDVWDDGGFALNCGSSILVVPMTGYGERHKKGTWVYINGELTFHKRIKKPTLVTKIISYLFG